MIKYLSIALAIALLALGIATKYAMHEHDALVTYTAQVTQERTDQKTSQLAKENENAEQAAIVAKTWKGDHDNLVAKLNGLRNGTTAGSGTTDEAALNACVASSAYWKRVGTGLSFTQFFGNALQAESNLRGIRDWVAREHIPQE